MSRLPNTASSTLGSMGFLSEFLDRFLGLDAELLAPAMSGAIGIYKGVGEWVGAMA